METIRLSALVCLLLALAQAAFTQQKTMEQMQQEFENYRRDTERDFNAFVQQRERELLEMEKAYQDYYNELHDLRQQYLSQGDEEAVTVVDELIEYENQITAAAGKDIQPAEVRPRKKLDETERPSEIEVAPVEEKPQPAQQERELPAPAVPDKAEVDKPETTFIPLPEEGDGVPRLTPLPSTKAKVTSPFGLRNHPILKRRKMHNGIDFGSGMNAHVYAAAHGKVLLAQYSNSFGNWIMIEHQNGYTSIYAHLNSMEVRKGQRVRKGDKIGLTGSTGRSTGPHLHYEVRLNGTPINPEGYLAEFPD